MSDAVPLSDINLDVQNNDKEGSEENNTTPTHYKTLPAGGLRRNSKSDNTHPLTGENPVKDKCNNVVQLRRRPRVQKSKLKRRCSINGHYYNREVSDFLASRFRLSSF